MSFADIYQISGSAMSAQTVRLNTVASNIANAESPAASEAATYKARSPKIFQVNLIIRKNRSLNTRHLKR